MAAVPAMPQSWIKPSSEHNVGVLQKSAKRIASILVKYQKHPDPIRLDPNSTGCSMRNRKPNMQYLHRELAPNLKTKGYDPARPRIGYVISNVSEKNISAMIKYNQELAAGTDLFPPIVEIMMKHEVLAGQHLSLTLRCFKAGMVSSLTGDAFTVPADDSALGSVSQRGHRYFEIVEDIPNEDAEFLAEWENSDQNQNNVNSEAQLIKAIQSICIKEMKINVHVKLAGIVQKVCGESIIKLRPDVVGEFARFVMDMGVEQYIDEYCTWHSLNVNPKTLTTSATWFGELTKAMGRENALLKLSIIFIHCSDTECVLQQNRPHPDIARLVGVPDLNTLARDKNKMAEIEKFLRDTRTMFEATMIPLIGRNPTTMTFVPFQRAVARLALSKSKETEFHHTVIGKYTFEKMEELRESWVRHVAASSVTLSDIAAKVGFEFKVLPLESEDGGKDEVRTTASSLDGCVICVKSGRKLGEQIHTYEPNA